MDTASPRPASLVKMEVKKRVIKTIYHKEVADFFESIGLIRNLMEKKIHCSICGDVITLENFRAVTRKKDDLLFCCKKESCIREFTASAISASTER
jgi:dimeric dUTPase (all-alpha-NTP-PPase superfamily)